MLNKNYEKILSEGILLFHNKNINIDQISNLYKDSRTFYDFLKKDKRK